MLKLAVVIGELRREHLKEYEAVPIVEDLYSKFKEKMSTLIRMAVSPKLNEFS